MTTRIDEFLDRVNCREALNSAADRELIENAQQRDRLPLVVPWKSTRGVVRWYLVCDESSVEWVREEALAHVGVSATDFTGSDTPPRVDDPVEMAVAEIWPGTKVFRVTLVTAGALDHVTAAVKRLSRRFGKPAPAAAARNSLSELLRELQMSLRAGDETSCEALLAEIRRRALLSPVNCRFLEFQCLVEFRLPLEVLEDDLFPALARIRRPPQVTDLMAVTIDRASLRPAPGLTLEQVRSNYRELPNSYRSLLTSLGECRSSSGVLLAALHASENGLKFSRRHLLVKVDELVESALSAVWADKTSVAVPDASDVLRQSLADGNYDGVLDAAEELGPHPTGLQAALLAAVQLNSLEAAARVARLLDAATPPTLEALLDEPLFAMLVERVRALAADADSGTVLRVSGWLNLLSAVEQRSPWAQAVEIAEHGSTEWPTGEFESGQQGAVECAEALRRLHETEHPDLRALVPHLLTWLSRVRADGLSDSVRPIIVEVVRCLTAPGASAADLKVVCSLVDDVVDDAVDDEQLTSVLRLLDRRLAESMPRSCVSRVLDVVYACSRARPTADDRLSALLCSLLSIVASRIPGGYLGVRAIANHLYGAHCGGSIEVDMSMADGVSNLSVLVLASEGIGEEVQQNLGTAWPGLQAHLIAGQLVDGERADLIRNCDLVVVAPSAADWLRNEVLKLRGRSRDLSIVAGAGPASVLEEVDSWIDRLL